YWGAVSWMPNEISWYMWRCDWPVPPMTLMMLAAFGGPLPMSNIIAAMVRGERAGAVMSASVEEAVSDAVAGPSGERESTGSSAPVAAGSSGASQAETNAPQPSAAATSTLDMARRDGMVVPRYIQEASRPRTGSGFCTDQVFRRPRTSGSRRHRSPVTGLIPDLGAARGEGDLGAGHLRRHGEHEIAASSLGRETIGVGVRRRPGDVRCALVGGSAGGVEETPGPRRQARHEAAVRARGESGRRLRGADPLAGHHQEVSVADRLGRWQPGNGIIGDRSAATAD